MHNAFVNVDNRKMSKSEGNFFTVREIGAVYPLSVLRFFLLSVHYRSPINFSKEIMEASKNGLERIQTAAEQLEHLLTYKKEQNQTDTKLTEEETLLVQKLETLHQKFDASMEDDFNTADAVTAIFEIVRLANTTLNGDSSYEILQLAYSKLLLLCDILGLEALKKKETLEEEVEHLIALRQEARKAKDFKKADEIRETLTKMGILLEDTREGVKWKKA